MSIMMTCTGARAPLRCATLWWVANVHVARLKNSCVPKARNSFGVTTRFWKRKAKAGLWSASPGHSSKSIQRWFMGPPYSPGNVEVKASRWGRTKAARCSVPWSLFDALIRTSIVARQPEMGGTRRQRIAVRRWLFAEWSEAGGGGGRHSSERAWGNGSCSLPVARTSSLTLPC